MADKLSNHELAIEILQGKWGNGQERRSRVTAAGYDYMAVQSIVNSLVNDGWLNKPEIQNPDKEPEPTKTLLEIDYDPQKNEGIQINIIV